MKDALPTYGVLASHLRLGKHTSRIGTRIQLLAETSCGFDNKPNLGHKKSNLGKNNTFFDRKIQFFAGRTKFLQKIHFFPESG